MYEIRYDSSHVSVGGNTSPKMNPMTVISNMLSLVFLSSASARKKPGTIIETNAISAVSMSDIRTQAV